MFEIKPGDCIGTTNKLLYLIYGELQEIRRAVSQSEPQNIVTEQIEAPQLKDGPKCKYCGEIVEGNRGNLLAHIRKCEKRT